MIFSLEKKAMCHILWGVTKKMVHGIYMKSVKDRILVLSKKAMKMM